MVPFAPLALRLPPPPTVLAEGPLEHLERSQADAAKETRQYDPLLQANK